MSKDFTTWDYTFMLEARLWASKSKDPSRKIGAVIVQNRDTVATGYNGFPSRMNDKEEYLNNRDEKYKRTIHAEKNAIYNALKRGNKVEGATMYVYGLPVCSKCAIDIIQSGIESIIYCDISSHIESRGVNWLDEGEETHKLFHECGVLLKEMQKKDLDMHRSVCYKGL